MYYFKLRHHVAHAGTSRLLLHNLLTYVNVSIAVTNLVQVRIKKK